MHRGYMANLRYWGVSFGKWSLTLWFYPARRLPRVTFGRIVRQG